jgi:hypothetical protein
MHPSGGREAARKIIGCSHLEGGFEMMKNGHENRVLEIFSDFI